MILRGLLMVLAAALLAGGSVGANEDIGGSSIGPRNNRHRDHRRRLCHHRQSNRVGRPGDRRLVADRRESGDPSALSGWRRDENAATRERRRRAGRDGRLQAGRSAFDACQSEAAPQAGRYVPPQCKAREGRRDSRQCDGPVRWRQGSIILILVAWLVAAGRPRRALLISHRVGRSGAQWS